MAGEINASMDQVSSDLQRYTAQQAQQQMFSTVGQQPLGGLDPVTYQVLFPSVAPPTILANAGLQAPSSTYGYNDPLALQRAIQADITGQTYAQAMGRYQDEMFAQQMVGLGITSIAAFATGGFAVPMALSFGTQPIMEALGWKVEAPQMFNMEDYTRASTADQIFSSMYRSSSPFGTGQRGISFGGAIEASDQIYSAMRGMGFQGMEINRTLPIFEQAGMLSGLNGDTSAIAQRVIDAMQSVQEGMRNFALGLEESAVIVARASAMVGSTNPATMSAAAANLGANAMVISQMTGMPMGQYIEQYMDPLQQSMAPFLPMGLGAANAQAAAMETAFMSTGTGYGLVGQAYQAMGGADFGNNFNNAGIGYWLGAGAPQLARMMNATGGMRAGTWSNLISGNEVDEDALASFDTRGDRLEAQYWARRYMATNATMQATAGAAAVGGMWGKLDEETDSYFGMIEGAIDIGYAANPAQAMAARSQFLNTTSTGANIWRIGNAQDVWRQARIDALTASGTRFGTRMALAGRWTAAHGNDQAGRRALADLMWSQADDLSSESFDAGSPLADLNTLPMDNENSDIPFEVTRNALAAELMRSSELQQYVALRYGGEAGLGTNVSNIVAGFNAPNAQNTIATQLASAVVTDWYTRAFAQGDTTTGRWMGVLGQSPIRMSVAGGIDPSITPGGPPDMLTGFFGGPYEMSPYEGYYLGNVGGAFNASTFLSGQYANLVTSAMGMVPERQDPNEVLRRQYAPSAEAERAWSYIIPNLERTPGFENWNEGRTGLVSVGDQLIDMGSVRNTMDRATLAIGSLQDQFLPEQGTPRAISEIGSPMRAGYLAATNRMGNNVSGMLQTQVDQWRAANPNQDWTTSWDLRSSLQDYVTSTAIEGGTTYAELTDPVQRDIVNSIIYNFNSDLGSRNEAAIQGAFATAAERAAVYETGLSRARTLTTDQTAQINAAYTRAGLTTEEQRSEMAAYLMLRQQSLVGSLDQEGMERMQELQSRLGDRAVSNADLILDAASFGNQNRTQALENIAGVYMQRATDQVAGRIARQAGGAEGFGYENLTGRQAIAAYLLDYESGNAPGGATYTGDNQTIRDLMAGRVTAEQLDQFYQNVGLAGKGVSNEPPSLAEEFATQAPGTAKNPSHTQYTEEGASQIQRAVRNAMAEIIQRGKGGGGLS